MIGVDSSVEGKPCKVCVFRVSNYHLMREDIVTVTLSWVRLLGPEK